MARTAKITLNDVTYTLCFSTRVMCEVEDSGTPFTEYMSNLKSTKRVVHLLALLLKAGYKHDKDQGLEPESPPSEDYILDNTSVLDYPKLEAALIDAIDAGISRKVEARPKSKKAGGATQAE